MKSTLILFTLVFVITQVSAGIIENIIISPPKYPYIGSCYYYDPVENLTFVCVENARQHNFFTSAPSMCLNQHMFSCCRGGYQKHWIKHINFQSCERPELPSDFFKVYKSVLTFDMSQLRLTSLPVNMFSDAAKLVKLNVSNNEISEIPSFLFHKNEQLTEVDFAFNKIEVIDDYAFAGDFNLEKIILSHNQIASFDKGILEAHSNLTHLDISNNRISILKEDTFGTLRNLVSLNLSSNSIKKLEYKTFENLANLQHLNLSRNNLSEIEPKTFLNQTNLLSLDLSHNKLMKLDIHVFTPRPDQLQLLVIGHNQLRELNGFTSYLIPNTKIVGIDTNQFNCSYLKRTLFPSITWKHLDSIANRINCSSSAVVESTTTDATTFTTTVRSMATTTKSILALVSSDALLTTTPTVADNMTTTTIVQRSPINDTSEGKVTLSDEKNQPPKENESNRPNPINVEAKHEGTSNSAHTTLLMINTLILVIIAIALVWILLQKRTPKNNVSSQVTYHRNAAEASNCVENNEYEEIVPSVQNDCNRNSPTNRLQTVPDDLFSDAAKLIRLDLSSNRIDTLAEKAFEKCQKLELLNLSGNILSEIKLGVFSSLTNLQTLDLSENRLNTLDINVLSMQLDQMKLLSIRNNQLQELNGFNSTRIVNMKIVGIDSNRFNCSYLKTLIQSINRTHLDVVSNRNECSPGNGLPTNSGNELTTLNPLNKKVDETIHENFKSQNEDSRNSTQTILLIINTTLLLIMTITLISALVWMLIRKRSQKIDIFPQVTYRRNVQPPKSIEQNEYEEIRNNITEPPAYLEPLLGEIKEETFKELSNLKFLNLKEMNLVNFDFATIGHLSQLEKLDISKNHLRNLDSMSTLKRFEKLKDFDVSDNNLGNGGDLIRQLPSSLTSLDISGNYVGEIISNMFSTLNQLVKLNLSRTNLLSFNISAIEHLRSLRWLSISQNGLKKVNFTLLSTDSVMSLNSIYLDMNDLNELDTLLPEQFPEIHMLNISNNRFSCKYLDNFKLQWIQSDIRSPMFYDDGCFDGTESSTTTHPDHDGSSNLVLYIVPPCVVIIAVVAVVVVVPVVRRRRSKENGVQTTVVYTQDEPTIKSDVENVNPANHFYEEIKERPTVYDRLRFETDPMPLSQHTLTHYDNARILKHELKMKLNLIWIALAFLTAQVLAEYLEIDGFEKYPHIGDCYYYDDVSGESNLTFVCVESSRQHDYFKSDVSSKCLNQHIYITPGTGSNGYSKAWIGTINFQDCEQPELPKNLFNVYNNLHTFNMSYLGLTSLPVNMFSDAVHLINLNASHNQIEEIPSFLFHSNDEMSQIDFSFNKIRTISDFAFAGKLILRKLDLSHNRISAFNKKMFDSNAILKRLDISKNRISILEKDSFETLQELVQLDLSANKLSEIKTGVFSSLTELQLLDLSENRLKTLDINVLPMQLDQMKSLSIRNNQLQELNGFNSTRIVNMKIAGIDTNRFNCSYLKTLIQLITHKHLDVISNRIECSPGNELTTLNPLNKKVSPTDEKNERPNESKCDETIHENFKNNNEHSSNSTQTILLIINTTLLLVITIALISALVWMLIRKRSQKIDIFPQVTYRRNVQPPKSIEQNEYEEIRNNFSLHEPPAYLRPLA
ncbi:uncharacterized protein LOC129568128 [Sitodiplosis mosellana]|uniref:uncharacterized protein LOC129568128 n=1 Tax=Sitodiplosis mosellana TaxID=263140 RepID=UPI0024441E06|nr:uncharacterized protein LOC129568128 [Sitodiplosis mosellana]